MKKAGRRADSATTRTPRDVDLFDPSIVGPDVPTPASSVNPPPPILVTQSQLDDHADDVNTITPASMQTTRVAKRTDGKAKSAPKQMGTVAKAPKSNTTAIKKSSNAKKQDKKKKKKKKLHGNKKVTMDNDIWEWMGEMCLNLYLSSLTSHRRLLLRPSGINSIRPSQSKSTGDFNEYYCHEKRETISWDVVYARL